ncbi:Hypothetical protein HVR_LOCUS957 [uncultured virus]|nr:Hypothetical protein HVR_LOCUS957 [uncultured virus]
MSTVNFYFIRHEESEANIDTRNIIGGQNLTVPLTNKGKAQACNPTQLDSSRDF